MGHRLGHVAMPTRPLGDLLVALERAAPASPACRELLVELVAAKAAVLAAWLELDDAKRLLAGELEPEPRDPRTARDRADVLAEADAHSVVTVRKGQAYHRLEQLADVMQRAQLALEQAPG